MFNETFLTTVGLADLPAPAKPGYLEAFRNELEMAVGRRIASQLTAAQLNEFEAVRGAGDEPAALAWLESHFPGYRTVVNEEFAALKERVRGDADAILALETLYDGGDVDAPEPEPATPSPQITIMHALLTSEFGDAVSIHAEKDMVVVELEGSVTPILGYVTSSETVTFQSGVHPFGVTDDPELGEYLLRRNGTLIFGRLHRRGEREIAVDHSLFTAGLTAAQLHRVVLALREVALETTGELSAKGLVTED